MTASPRTALAIIAGGESSRFGSNKLEALLPNGRTLFQHACDRWSRACSTSVVVASRPLPDESIACIPDAVDGAGPVSAITSALHWAKGLKAERLLVVAADLPLLPVASLMALTSCEGAVVLSGSGTPVLAAEFPVGVANQVSSFLHAGGRRYLKLLETLGAAWVALPEVRGGDLQVWQNINRPADLERLHAHFHRHHWHGNDTPLGI